MDQFAHAVIGPIPYDRALFEAAARPGNIVALFTMSVHNLWY